MLRTWPKKQNGMYVDAIFSIDHGAKSNINQHEKQTGIK